MRSLTRISIALVFAFGIFATGLPAQNRFGTPAFTGGFPNAVFPGGTPANYPGLIRFTPSAVYPGGGGPHLAVPGQRVHRYTGSRTIAVPFAVPVYLGGGYDNTPAPPAAQPPDVVSPPQPAPAIVNQYGSGYADQIPPDAGNPEPVSVYQPEQSDQPASDRYLIALKDHTVYLVVAYWVDGDTLHYFTARNVHNQVSLALVDRDITARLNKESGAEVKLPGDK